MTEVERIPVRYQPGMIRQAHIRLWPAALAQLIDLPDGMRVRRVVVDHDPQSIVVIVEGDSLPEVPEDTSTPPLDGMWDRRQILDDEGRPYVRFGWMPEVAAGRRAGSGAQEPSATAVAAQDGSGVSQVGSSSEEAL